MRTIDADEFKHTISSGMCTDSITFSILLGMMNGNTNLDETTNKIVREHIKEVNRLIDNAPTVESKRLRGKWIEREDMDYLDENKVIHKHFECNKCGLIHDFIDGHTSQYNFCPNCGADIRGEERMKEILDVIHKTIYQFFDVCGDDEEVPMSDKDKLLLEVNKAICNNLKALQQDEGER